jgi:cell division protein FtsZ
MGIGQASGENRAIDAAKAAIDSPLLELSIDGAKGVLFTITGGPNLSMYEVNEAARVITSSADPNAKIIFGSVIDEAMGDDVKITVIATGFGRGLKPQMKKISPTPATPFEEAKRPERNFAPSFKAENRMSMPSEEVPKKTKEEEELEIPAFIRKKMM